MFTRQDYINGKINHNDYYAQFVTPQMLDSIASYIGSDKLLSSTDPHLNDIPLKQWDFLPWEQSAFDKVREANGTGGVSLSDKVCIWKNAARQFIEREKNAPSN